MKKYLFIVNSLYLSLGMVYYYMYRDIPFECTSFLLKTVYWISLFLSTLYMGFLITQSDIIKNRILRPMTMVFVILLMLHNSIWTLYLLGFAEEYKDIKVTYLDKSNLEHKLIEQEYIHSEENKSGPKRTIEVYEIGLGIRYIMNR